MLKVGAIKVLLILGISSLKDSVGPEPGRLSLFCEPGLGIHVATRTVICFRSGKPLVTEHSEGLSLGCAVLSAFVKTWSGDPRAP